MKQNKNRGVAARPMEMAKSVLSALLVMALAFSAIIGVNTKKADAAGINGWTSGTTVLTYSTESISGSALTKKFLSESGGGNKIPVFCMNHQLDPAASSFPNRTFYSSADAHDGFSSAIAGAIYKNNLDGNTGQLDTTYSNSISGNDSTEVAAVERQLKTVLYYGYYGTSADAVNFRDNVNSNMTKDNWYIATQAAVWQISTYSKTYWNKTTAVTSLQGTGGGFYTDSEGALDLVNKALTTTSAPNITIGIGTDNALKSQDIIFGGGTHSMGTVVKVNGVDRGNTSEALKLRPDQAANVTEVIDTVSYTDFDNNTYVVYGELYEKDDSKNGRVIGKGQAELTVDGTDTNPTSGDIDVTITLNEKLQPGKTYIAKEFVYEKSQFSNITPGSSTGSYASHVEMNAPSQTIVVEGGTTQSIKTKVSVNGQTGTPATFNINDVQNATITDTITYSNFNDSTKEYDIYAELWKLGNASDTKVGSGSYKGVTPDASGTGEWNMTIAFDDGFQFEANTEYVVYEYVVNKNQDINAEPYENTNVANHKDRADKNQIIKIVDNNPPPSEPDIRTSVSVTVNGTTKTSPSGIKLEDYDVVDPVAVKDTITYTGMTAGETWNITGTLMDITNGPSNATPVAQATANNYSATGETGTWEMDFGNVQLELDHYYVVYEEATRTSDNNYIEHKNPKDKAQTIVVGNPPDPFTESQSQNTNEEGNTTTEAPATTLDGSTIKEGTNGKTKGPRTGDGNTLMTLIAAAGISAGALSLTLGARKSADK